MTEKLELAIIDSVRNILPVLILRSTDKGFSYMNEEALTAFQIESMDEAHALPRRQIFADSDSYYHVKMKLRAYGKIQNERILFHRCDRTNFWGRLTSVELVINGELVYDEVIVDISSEVEKEHKLAEKTHLLEKVHSELDRFVYSASHDLRAPISTMLGLVSIMKMDSSTQHSEYITLMKSTLGRLESHVKKLVDFLKITNEPISCDEVDLRGMLLEIKNELNTHPNYDRVQYRQVFVGNAIIHSDYVSVNTILYQILKNVYDYADLRKPKSFVSVKVINLNHQTKIEIVDNGIGIEREFVTRIFQMFYRATASSKGAGLGLYLVQEALVKVKGSIEVQSDFGVGTSIVAAIPDWKNNLPAP
ncbi:MAG: HAMP domain-containing histidine kinase [Bacteroidetes bacterium]|nr:HAMP domain-containing histidine kinase [Bacteroidota bacterium]